MSRVEQAFAKGKALITFVTAGDPDLNTTEQLVLEMARAGADLIELGIPFSDPVAEGPVIQRASMRALQAGTTTDKIFALVSRVREKSDVPLALMTYFNPVFAFGMERFLNNSREVGVDALIIPDLPFEERDEIMPYCRQYGIDLISMIAPTSKERIGRIATEATGFIYCVSSLGVTGVREKIGTEAENMVAMVKAVKDIPCAVGFGISSPEQARQVSQAADGVIVGSAIVQIVEQYGTGCIPQVSSFVQEMKQAINQYKD
ncbi:MAG TPA: tryptophan synthase subunit alpha [Syntrophomonadaceae bacterium]|nr:tryptophan synthase subunit alpha [Syntrophomonadaceae bacterium]HQE23714.1 tryptophan synthase subunit alpha [Syntrophomonadaceae bacterium]